MTSAADLRSRRLLGVVLLYLLPHSVPAQHPDIRFTHIPTDRGLSQSSVNAILRDRQGFMWFGTQDGLNRYDGIEFTIFRHSSADSLSISDNFIWSLLEDHEGTLWAGTQNGGLNRLREDGRTFTRYVHDPADSGTLSGNSITALCETSGGDIWVGTWGGGLDRLNRSTNSFEHFRETADPRPGLPNNFVRSLAEDRSGVLWIGTWGGGLAAYDPKEARFRRYRHDARDARSLSSDVITSLLVDRRGTLWVGTFDAGMDKFDSSTGTFTTMRDNPRDPSGISSNSVSALCEDEQGALWAATRDGGVNRYDPAAKRFSAFRRNPVDPDAPGSDRISSLYRDPAGSVWVGTNDAGVDQYDPDRPMFRHYIVNASNIVDLRRGVVRTIFEDSRGDLWVGTVSSGLIRYVRSSREYINYRHVPEEPGSLSNDAVMVVYEDGAGRLWVGTDGGGLDRFDRQTRTFTHYWSPEQKKRRISGNSVMSICEDRRGALLVGMTRSGVDLYDAGKDRFVPLEEALGIDEKIADNVWAIREDSKGRLWFGTWGQGLCMLDDERGTVTRYRNVPEDSTSLGNNTVWSICEDAGGILWLGTWGGGLNRLDPATARFTRFTERDGLSNNVVYGVLPDDGGNLWLSTNKGLTKFTPGNRSVRRFDHRDGLQSDEFNQGAYFRGHDGTLYFGGINGVNTFQPDSIRPNPHVPPVVLTRFRVFDRETVFSRPLSRVREIPLEYNENYLSFEFAALCFTEPEKNQYAYRMEGVDKEWIYCGTRRYAAYTHLDGGTYTFRVRGANNDGVWNEDGASVRIVIALPFWRRVWFLSACITGAALLVFALLRYRVAKLVEIERLRTTIASDLHDELASNLSSIAMFSNIVHDASGSAGGLDGDHLQLLDRITALSQDSVTSIRDIIWAIDPKSESVYDLLFRLKDYLLPLCRAADIQLEFPDPLRTALPGKNLKPGERKDLWLLLKETGTNAIRHSGCGRLAVNVVFAGGTLTITIRDDGTGFSPAPSSDGKGLRTMNMRAANLGGALTIDSLTGKGTTVTLAMKK